jgi:hypothetical protein
LKFIGLSPLVGLAVSMGSRRGDALDGDPLAPHWCNRMVVGEAGLRNTSKCKCDSPLLFFGDFSGLVLLVCNVFN